MKYNIKTRLYLGFALAIFLVLLIGAISLLTFKRQYKEAGNVRYSYRVINHLMEVQNLLIDMETARRGFRSTNAKVFLEPYYIAQPQMEAALVRTRDLLQKDPDQLKQFVVLEANVRKLMAYWRSLGEDASSYTRDIILGINTIEKRQMDAIRRQFEQLTAREMEQLNMGEESNRKAVSFAIYELVIGIALILTIIGVLIYVILREFYQRTRAQAELSDNNKELVRVNEASNEKNWLLEGSADVNNTLQGQDNVQQLCHEILTRLVTYLQMDAGAFYLYNSDDEKIAMCASVALPANCKKAYSLHDGLVGQAAASHQVTHLKNIPEKYLVFESGGVKMQAAEAVLAPLYYNEQLKGVVELLSFKAISHRQVELLNLVHNNIVLAVNSAQSREKVMQLLEKVQQQKEELENQQEELRQANEELSVQTEVLQASEEELRVQEEELRQINTELEEKNAALETARQALILKAKELEATSKYKSEFLANMSHELRTPLNSVLILAKLLADNQNKNLTEKQVTHAKIIHKSGSDLLKLINDILDLSKIEAGKIDLNIEQVRVKDFVQELEDVFAPLAEEKHIWLRFEVAADLPETIATDSQKLEQVLKNLLSNAIKFTDNKGEVIFRWYADRQQEQERFCIDVQDNGIGIAPAKQQLIFEAFQQADGSTSRKYGGTGLGLSITRELVRLLGGSILVSSTEGKGSTFTVRLPMAAVQPAPAETVLLAGDEDNAGENDLYAVEEQALVSDDRKNIDPADKLMLVVEDDQTFASVLRDMAREKGYKVLVALRGDEGLYYARKYQPHAIILDMQLPVLDGATVLKRLKADKALRHIPVHIMSGLEEANVDASAALAFLKKPVMQKELDEALTFIGEYLQSAVKKVLLVSGEHLKNEVMQQLLHQRHFDVQCDVALSWSEGLELANANPYDCIVAELGNSVGDGMMNLRMLQQQTGRQQTPLIVFLDEDISRDEEIELKKIAGVIVRKSTSSYNRLMDELELFLYKVHEQAPGPKITAALNGAAKSGELKNRKVLLVDDDMRNVFAITSALEQEQMDVLTASDGRDALEILRKHPEVELVLMDIMMPEMDGYEAIKYIRHEMRLTHLPVIALTAKAMTGDREKCIQAGASDYITKPVDLAKLVSLMRVWLS